MGAKRRLRVIVWGLGHVGSAVARAALRRDDLALVRARVFGAEDGDRDVGELLGVGALGVRASTSTEALLAEDADCVVFTPSPLAPREPLVADLVRLLESGKNVVSTASLDASSAGRLAAACHEGRASFHATGLHPTFLIERLAMTLARAQPRVDHVRVVQALDFGVCPEGLWGGLAALGFGRDPASLRVDALDARGAAFAASMGNAAGVLQGARAPDVRVERSVTGIAARESFTVRGTYVAKGSAAAIHLVQRAFVGERHFFTNEECWYLGPEPFRGEGAPFGGFTQPLSFTLRLEGDSATVDAQVELEPPVAVNPFIDLAAQAVLTAISPVCAADPGVVVDDARPRYRLDDRISGEGRRIEVGADPRARRRVIVWGPGEVGGAVVRAIAERPDMRIVGAKVFSPHKDGEDLGELVGMPPLGVRATVSKAEILAMQADCVVVTPMPRSIVTGLDRDVIDLLESGKNVVTSAAYHNVTMPNWLGSARTRTEWMREITSTTGVARSRAEAIALAASGRLARAADSRALGRFASVLLDRVLAPALDLAFPLRATPERLQRACERGRVSLHGTGVHPTFMAERVGMTLASALSSVDHVRFVEAADFSYTPDGMWGGLSALGFGRPLEELHERFLIAKAGDFYYGDVIGNAAHALFGAPSSAVRVVRRFRGLPAKQDFHVGSVRIREGTAAALHMVHEGYLGERCFFTNEECWYLGPNLEYRGDRLPFGGFTGPISYTIEITGRPANLRMQLALDGAGETARLLDPARNLTADARSKRGQQARARGLTNPITQATAMAIRDAIGPVCDAPPGIVIDDTRPAFRMGELR